MNRCTCSYFRSIRKDNPTCPVHSPPEPTVPSPDNEAELRDKLRIAARVYDCLYEQETYEIDVAKFLAALDRAGLEVREKE